MLQPTVNVRCVKAMKSAVQAHCSAETCDALSNKEHGMRGGKPCLFYKDGLVLGTLPKASSMRPFS